MKTLGQLLEGMEYTLVQGSLDVEIQDLEFDSRCKCEGKAFVCITGTRFDAHNAIPAILANGPAALIVEKEVDVPADVTVVRVPSTRRAKAELSSAQFDYPTRKMTTIGFTGTKGKTTSTHMLKAILEKAGKKVGMIGTNGCYINKKFYETKNTTPDPYLLHQFFKQMVDEGCEYMLMEVSSQGLMMDRVAGIDFDLGVFTNLSPDHIGPDEHSSFEEYRYWKGQLFKMCKTGIVNADDENCEALLEGHTCQVVTFGQNPSWDYHAENISRRKDGNFMGIGFDLKGKTDMAVEVGIPGLFNAYNAISAVVAALVLGIDEKSILEAIRTIRVNGRMEMVYTSDHCSIIVDYAHNGVSTRSLLQTLREYQPKRLVVVFGCGGNRAASRRYEMGEASGSMADLSIITADNSRDEKVEDIMHDIHVGMEPTGGKYIDIPDRREAIRYSIEHAEAGDVIAIIGKGHETYQEIKGKRTHFSDREEAEAVLRDLGWME